MNEIGIWRLEQKDTGCFNKLIGRVSKKATNINGEVERMKKQWGISEDLGMDNLLAR